MGSKKSKELLADRLRNRLSHNAYENIWEAEIRMDPTEMGRDVELKAHLRDWPPEYAEILLDFERTVGGARRTNLSVYGVEWRPGTQPDGMLALSRGEYLGLRYIRGRLFRAQEDGLDALSCDDYVQYFELEYLMPRRPDRHVVTFPHSLGAWVAEQIGAELFAPACGKWVHSWLGYDAAVTECLDPYRHENLDQTPGITGLMTENTDTAVRVMLGALDEGYQVRWVGPRKTWPGNARQHHKNKKLVKTFTINYWDIDLQEIEVSICGEPGNYSVTRSDDERPHGRTKLIY